MRIATTILAAPFLIILYLNIEKYAESKGWDGLLMSLMEGRMPTLLSVLLQPWMGVLALSLAALASGLWVGSLARVMDKATATNQPDKEPDKYTLSNQINHVMDLITSHSRAYTERNWVSDFNLIGELQALSISLSKIGIKFPESEQDVSERQALIMIWTLLRRIEPLVRRGHFDVAAEAATEMSKEISRAKPDASL